MSTVTHREEQTSDSVKTIFLSWEIDESNIEELKSVINLIIEDDSTKNLIVNIKELTYINSMVIWWFANLINDFTEAGKSYVFAEYNESIYDILDLVWLTYAVETYETNEEALLSFEK